MPEQPTNAANKPQGPGGKGPGGKPGGRRVQKSRYGTQMAEKQSLKGIYGIREAQLRKYYSEALRSNSETGPELISLLERRLDNAIFRLGLAPTRPAARQMASHRLMMVNGRPVDVPSYRLKVNDVVSIHPGKRGKALFSNFDKRMQNVRPPSWIALDAAAFSFKIVALPSSDEANTGVDAQAIVEFFAR